ncbi:hypothetical protein GT354_38180, partial [Streptomyces sp. SID3343]|nr:hypothetical protein [Streptomyces sp. SID3343]
AEAAAPVRPKTRGPVVPREGAEPPAKTLKGLPKRTPAANPPPVVPEEAAARLEMPNELFAPTDAQPPKAGPATPVPGARRAPRVAKSAPAAEKAVRSGAASPLPKTSKPARKGAAKPAVRIPEPAKPQESRTGDGAGPVVSSIGRTRRGLPKRLVAGEDTGPVRALPTPDPAKDTGALSADELRRRLTGFQEGFEAARREDDPVVSPHDEPSFPPDAREETGGGDR